MNNQISKVLFASSLFFCSAASVAEEVDFLKEFKMGNIKYKVEERDGFFAYLQYGFAEYFFTDKTPVSIYQARDDLSLLRVVDYKNKTCAYGYYIIEHSSDYPMVSEYLPTCGEHKNDSVYFDNSGTLHIESKSVKPVKVVNISYNNGKIINGNSSL